MYARRIEGKWLLEEIDDARLVKFSSLALDNLGVPHVAYYDSQYGDLWYATRPTHDEPWTRYIVDQEGDVGNSASIDVDASGAVHITYFDNTRATLKYATTLIPVSVQETNWTTVKSSFR